MNKKEFIFKELKRRFNLLEKQNYEVAFIALQGSQNYNFDIYTDEYKSDLDCFAIIIPSFDDFVNNKSPISTTMVLENNEHIGLKDIRTMFELFRKQNQQYLELLFTDYKIVNRKYKEILKPLFDNAENIAKINKKNLYNAIIGTAYNKLTALEHPYPTIKWKIDKYGYDGKQLHHLIRCSQFINNIDKGMSFKESLTHFEALVYDVCLKAKLNEYSLEEARFLANSTVEQIEKKRALVKDKTFSDNEEYVELLEEIKIKIMKAYFTEQLLPKEIKPFDLDKEIKKYKKVFAISDTHFGHSNILEFKDRQKYMNINTVEEMDQILIDNWNRKVSKGDLVLILGDFSFYPAKKTMEILKTLNGDKVLIEGNHDCIYLLDGKFDKSLFKAILPYREIRYKDIMLVLMHFPLLRFKHQDKEGKWLHLFGHIHSREMIIPKYSYNVGADVNNYTPIELDEAIEKAKANNDYDKFINKRIGE